jgi:hypothetical protein
VTVYRQLSHACCMWTLRVTAHKLASMVFDHSVVWSSAADGINLLPQLQHTCVHSQWCECHAVHQQHRHTSRHRGSLTGQHLNRVQGLNLQDSQQGQRCSRLLTHKITTRPVVFTDHCMQPCGIISLSDSAASHAKCMRCGASAQPDGTHQCHACGTSLTATVQAIMALNE